MPYSIAHHPLPSDPLRDAIHVPIIKVTLQQHGFQGLQIHVTPEGLAYRPNSNRPANAVIDPFKTGDTPIPPGTVVWAFFIPQNVRLTHVWEHDDLPLSPNDPEPTDIDSYFEECRNCY